MGDVLEFKSKQAAPEPDPHLTGKALCLDCKHEWVSVAPVGAVWLECPACGLVRGRFWSFVSWVDKLHYACPCGYDVFFVHEDGIACPNCSLLQRFGNEIAG